MSRKEGNQTFHSSTFDIYVGNVPKTISEADLKQLFLKYGEVKQVLCRRKDDYIGYAIVKFTYKLDAERVLHTTDEVIWNGHHMPVKTARRSDHSQQNGNGGIENKPNSYPDLNKGPLYHGSQFSNTDFGYFHPSMYTEDQPMYSQPMMLEVLCTNVEDAITFYGCPVNRSEELALLLNALNHLNLFQNRGDRKPIAKRVYAALFSEDKSWYRCSVIQSVLPNKPGMCSVRYIDYGNQEETDYRNICELPEALQKIPPFASRFVFSNLVCDIKQPNKKTYLHQLVNKRMSLCTYLSNASREYRVVKCSCNGKDVISETVHKGFATPQRSPPSRPDVHNEFAPKPKAYACGTEIKLRGPNSDMYQVHASKIHETPCLMNGTLSNSKMPRKIPAKSKDVSPKNEDTHCNETFPDESKKDPEFHPKMIIKRGSELSDMMKCNGSFNQPKDKAPSQQISTCTSMIDSVIPNLKLINNIRGLVSQSSDDSIINCAVDLLKEEISTIELTENSKRVVGDAYDEYSEAVNKIKNCSDKTLLPSLKLERDLCRNTLCSTLKEYLGSCDSSIFERKEKIQKTITDLESNSNAWMNVQLEKKPSTLEELIAEYKKVKDDRWNLVSETRENTNQKHKQFMDLFDVLHKEFYLNTSDEKEVLDFNTNACGSAKTTSYSNKLNEALIALGKALDEEIHMLTLNKDTKNISVIQCLLDILDIHKEKVDSVCEFYEERYAKYNELSKVPDIETTLTELVTIEEDVHNLALQLSEFKNSQMEKEETVSPEMTALVKELHHAILREDCLKGILAKASESYFPELKLEHPELRLFNHSRNKFLLKDWNLNYFLNLGNGPRGESSFVSHLLDEPVVIKEYLFQTAEESSSFIQKAILWNEIKSDSLVKIKALFLKDEKSVCVVLPPVSSTLFENAFPPSLSEGEKACRILRQVLSALKDIHSEDLVHRSVHPLTVVIENNRASLDFCYDSSYLDGNTSLKGISFQPPENKAMHETTDMYGFGCMVLWVLFPNLSFTATAEGVPNVAAFRSIIEELILPKDYALLSALVDAKPERRPSSSILFNKGFLSKYEAYCRSRCDSQQNS